MGGMDCTPEEHARIMRGETNYSDHEWSTCTVCGGSGDARDGNKCLTCRGLGEIPSNEEAEITNDILTFRQRD